MSTTMTMTETVVPTDVLEYIETLEDTIKDLDIQNMNLGFEAGELEVENLSLRRTIAAYKANATRRANTQTQTATELTTLRELTETLRTELAATRASNAAFKANATRRARARS